MNFKNDNLSKIADELRKDVMKMVHNAGDGHPGPALSITEIIVSLYFNIMNINPKFPLCEERDRLILSKGHACPVLYAALARKGYFDLDNLKSLRKYGSILQGHPDMKTTPGIDFTSGSLGNGISIGLGMAVAAKLTGYNNYIYVITGDGELQEGIIWESAMAATKFKADNLIVFVDFNNLQSGGTVDEISALNPLLPKWESFGWHCQEVDGHDTALIIDAASKAKTVNDKPSVIICHTIKGKGISYMEGDNSWHKRVPSDLELKKAIELLGGEDK